MYYSDPAVKQLLLLMNGEDAFIIEDLDESHLFIDPQAIDRVRERFEVRMEENVYKLSDGQVVTANW